MSEEKQFNIHINTVNGTYLVQGNDDGVKNLIAAITKAKVLGDSIDIPGWLVFSMLGILEAIGFKQLILQKITLNTMRSRRKFGGVL